MSLPGFYHWKQPGCSRVHLQEGTRPRPQDKQHHTQVSHRHGHFKNGCISDLKARFVSPRVWVTSTEASSKQGCWKERELYEPQGRAAGQWWLGQSRPQNRGSILQPAPGLGGSRE